MTDPWHLSTHPPLPPTTEDDRISALRLLRSPRIGPRSYHRLLAEYGSAAAALAALPEIARAAGNRHYQTFPESDALRELRAGRKARAQLIAYGTSAYPPLLMQLDDPPPLLWAMGDLSLLTRPAISIVGARNASSLGRRMARRLAAECGEAGFVVVSGLARGIDAEAHRAALSHGTIAVQPGGIDVLYPRENTELAGEIARHGLRLSEQPIGMAPQARHFPARNRIVSGLSLATLVVEAAQRSGSLITADHAARQGREVLAVPGHPLDPASGGSNLLLRDGATLIRSTADILDAVPAFREAPSPRKRPLPTPKPLRPLREIADLHRKILARIGPAPIAEDQLARDLGAAPERLAPALTDLELDGEIARHSGGTVRKAK